MTSNTLSDAVARLTKPPSPTEPLKEGIPSGEVWLYKDSDWDSTTSVLEVSEYVPGKRHIVESKIHDMATWVAYNLPLGTVVTLIECITPVEQGEQVQNLRDCGVCLDLVGTGKTETVDLKQTNMNDKISMFFWRTVDITRGAIELFDNDNFRGGRVTIFLSEWEPGKVHSINGWWINDKITSVRWNSLVDRQTASLINNPDGSGKSYDNIKGWARIKEVADFKQVAFNDVTSGFRWDSIIPVKEVMEPFLITTDLECIEGGMEHHGSGKNQTSQVMTAHVEYQVGTVREWSITTTEEHVAGIEVNITKEAEAGIPELGNLKATWSVTLRYSYSNTKSTTTVTTNSTNLGFKQDFAAPPHTSYTWDVVAYVGKIPKKKYYTKATRWYDAHVTSSELDPENENLYKRVEDVSVTVSGILAARTNAIFKTTPLPL